MQDLNWQNHHSFCSITPKKRGLLKIWWSRVSTLHKISLCTQSLHLVKVISYHFLCCYSNGFRIFHHSGLIINKSSFRIWRCTFIQLHGRGKNTALKSHNKQHTLQAIVKLYYIFNSMMSLSKYPSENSAPGCTEKLSKYLKPGCEHGRCWERAVQSFWAWGLLLGQGQTTSLLS